MIIRVIRWILSGIFPYTKQSDFCSADLTYHPGLKPDARYLTPHPRKREDA